MKLYSNVSFNGARKISEYVCNYVNQTMLYKACYTPELNSNSFELSERDDGIYLDREFITKQCSYREIAEKILLKLLSITVIPPFDTLDLIKKGQSKEIRKLSDSIVLVKLINSISSHTNNSFGNIENNNTIRYSLNDNIMKYLKMKNCNVAYIGMITLNTETYIVEKLVYSPPIECIVKSKFVGTPVKDYEGITKLQMRNKKYLSYCGNFYNNSGKNYILRFDWRNPASSTFYLNKHEFSIIPDNIKEMMEYKILNDRIECKVLDVRKADFSQTINRLLDTCEDKESYAVFYKLSVSHFKRDMVMGEEYADLFINTEKAKYTISQAYGLLCDLFSSMNYELWDMCFTLTEDGSLIFGEISPDCMRLKRKVNGYYINYDKDIWRKYGKNMRERASDFLIENWTKLNNDIESYLRIINQKTNSLISGNSVNIFKKDGKVYQQFYDTVYSGKLQRSITIPGIGKLRQMVTNKCFDYLEANGIKTCRIKNETNKLFEIQYFDVPPIEVIVKTRYIGSHLEKYDLSNSDYNLSKGDKYKNPVVEFCYRNKLPRKDEVLSDDMAEFFIDVKSAKKTAIKVFDLLHKFFSSFGYDLLDICLFLDKQGKTIIEEISFDNTRLVDKVTNLQVQRNKHLLIDDKWKVNYFLQVCGLVNRVNNNIGGTCGN